MTTKDNSSKQPTDCLSVAAAFALGQSRDHPPASRLAAAPDDDGGVPASRAPLALAFRTKNAVEKNATALRSGLACAGNWRGENHGAWAPGQGGGKNFDANSGVGFGLRAQGNGKRGAG